MFFFEIGFYCFDLFCVFVFSVGFLLFCGGVGCFGFVGRVFGSSFLGFPGFPGFCSS